MMEVRVAGVNSFIPSKEAKNWLLLHKYLSIEVYTWMHETAVTATNYLQGGVLFSRRVIRSKVAAARLNCRLHVAEHSLPAWLIIFFVGLLSMPGLPLSTNNGGIAMRSVMRRHSHFEIKYAKQKCLSDLNTAVKLFPCIFLRFIDWDSMLIIDCDWILALFRKFNLIYFELASTLLINPTFYNAFFIIL